MSIGLEGYRSFIDKEDLSLVYIGHCVLEDFEIELSGPESWIDNPPPSRFGINEEAFKVGRRFPLPPFVLKLLRSYQYHYVF